jgi:alpha-beta hydrolase superfamily lysophospholipase
MIRRWFLRFLLLVVLLVGALAFWPPEPPLAPPRFDAAALPEDLDGYLATREATMSGITDGTQKRIIWAGAPGTRTPLAIVYIHGFSATSEEIRPVPDLVARELGANLFFTRLAGHGRDGPALAEATVDDWLLDLAEALAIGARIGDRVIVMATSTGATLALAGLGTPDIAAALPGAEAVAGLAFVSPNLRLATPAGALLDLPGARVWGPWVAGRTREFRPENDGHARYWTTRYPTDAVFPMARLMRAARAVDPATMRVPLVLAYAREDMVVDGAAAEELALRWGGAVQSVRIEPGPGVDPSNHVLAGDILSPAQTAPVSALITRWAGAL